jgi:hypothetical protein
LGFSDDTKFGTSELALDRLLPFVFSGATKCSELARLDLPLGFSELARLDLPLGFSELARLDLPLDFCGATKFSEVARLDLSLGFSGDTKFGTPELALDRLDLLVGFTGATKCSELARLDLAGPGPFGCKGGSKSGNEEPGLFEDEVTLLVAFIEPVGVFRMTFVGET